MEIPVTIFITKKMPTCTSKRILEKQALERHFTLVLNFYASIEHDGITPNDFIMDVIIREKVFLA